MNSGDGTRSRDHVQSLARGMAVLESFSAEHPRRSVSEVAHELGLTRATARRLLLTLVETGHLVSEETRYTPAPRLLDLGRIYLDVHGRWGVVRPLVEDLGEATQEACSVAVLDRWEVVYVVRVPTRRIMTVNLEVGARLPAHATSSGRVMLAALPPDRVDDYLHGTDLDRFTSHTITDPVAVRRELDRVREQGWAVLDQELEVGVRAVAVPLQGPDGRTVAALAVSAHAGRVSSRALVEDVLPLLTDTATAIEQALAPG